MKIKLTISFLSLLLLFSCTNNSTDPKINNPPTESKTIIQQINYAYKNSFPHDTNSFTEGFLFNNGNLYESTGATSSLPQTRSLFGIVDLKTGKIDAKVEIDKQKYFGEGITILNGKIFQLTYQTKIGFVYDANTYQKLKEFTFPSDEGWGMTTDGKNLIMSDGTNVLTYLDPNTLLPTKTLAVTEYDDQAYFLNELEFINGFIYANIWTTNKIVKIDPSSGKVIGKLDLTALVDEAKNLFRGSAEMNGIAYDSATDKIYVTGKMWPKIYEISFGH